MRGRLFGSRTGVIGCAFGESEIMLLQLQSRRATGTAIAAATRPVPAIDIDENPTASREVVINALRESLADGQFTGRKVVAILPDRLMQYRHLRLAPMPDSEIGPAVQWQTSRELEFPVDEFQTAFFNVGGVFESGKARREVVAVAAAVRDLEFYAQILQEAGLTPVAIDVRPACIARCLMAADEPTAENGSRFVIELRDSSSLVLITQNHVPRFIRTLEMGSSRCFGRLSEESASVRSEGANGNEMDVQGASDSPRLFVPPADVDSAISSTCSSFGAQLAHEVSLCLHYLCDARPNDRQPNSGCILGAGDHEAALVDAVNAASEIEFRTLEGFLPARLMSMLQTAASRNRPADAWLAPLGAALYGRENVPLRGAA